MKTLARSRLALAVCAVAGLTISTTHAGAATAVLDGKKTKSISFTAVPANQANEATATAGDLTGEARVACAAPQCAYVDFVYQPAKGVKAAGLAIESTWSTSANDVDLYVASLDRPSAPKEIGSCGATYGTRERIYLPASSFKPGKKYRVIVYFYRTVNETVTTKVTFNGPNTIPTTVPKDADGVVFPVNCGL